MTEIKVGDVISAYEDGIVLKYLGNNSGQILFISKKFADKWVLPVFMQEGSIWAVKDISVFKHCEAWVKFHKLDGLYGK